MSGLDQARGTARFISDAPLPGSFSAGSATYEVSLRDLSVLGAQIEHKQPLRPSMRGRLAIGTLDAAAVVVWTRMTVPGRYRSGLRLEAQLEVVAAAIREFLARGTMRKAVDTERLREQALLERSIARAEQRAAHSMQGAPAPEVVRAIQAARKWLLEHPDDAVKWYQRARRTATETHWRIAGSGRMNREDVLAVWEYIGRRFGLADVVRALDQAG